MRLTTLLAAFILATPALAQDREGRDTPGEWVVDHQKAFGLWDSFCDHRVTGGTREERCYIRYVDVFSRAPKFAAQFMFITPGPDIEFGLERGTFFAEEGFRIENQGATIWSEPQAGCLVGLACLYAGREAERLLKQMLSGDSFVFDFTDRHGSIQSLRWDLTSFADALEDFRKESAERGL